MSKYKVIKNFTDKYDKTKKYKVDDIIEFDDKRAKEILSVDKLIQKIKETKSDNEKEQPIKEK